MEDSAISNGFANLRDGSDYDSLYRAAECRQKVDVLVGTDATKLFSILYKTTTPTRRGEAKIPRKWQNSLGKRNGTKGEMG